LLIPASLFLVLRQWRRQLDAGHSPWFVRSSVRNLLALLVLLIILMRFIPNFGWDMKERPAFNFGGPFANYVMMAMMASGTFALAAQAFLWLWWCDRAPRSHVAVLAAIGVWVGIINSSLILPGLAAVVTDRLPTPSDLPVLATVSIPGSHAKVMIEVMYPWLTNLFRYGGMDHLYNLARILGYPLIAGVLALSVHYVARAYQRVRFTTS
jgi:hypothetical protein